MNAPPATEDLAHLKSEPLSVSRLIRRIHMFTGLFLAPWMLMYALSTLVMTHRDFVVCFYPSPNPDMVTERELDYTRSFSPDASRDEIGRQILQDLGLTGSTISVAAGTENLWLSTGNTPSPCVVLPSTRPPIRS